jgi:hypothetical protein
MLRIMHNLTSNGINTEWIYESRCVHARGVVTRNRARFVASISDGTSWINGGCWLAGDIRVEILVAARESDWVGGRPPSCGRVVVPACRSGAECAEGMA